MECFVVQYYYYMFYIVGLGNPGKEYEQNRHNVGFLMLDAFVQSVGLPQPVDSSSYAGKISEGVVANTEVAVLYPSTFMNKSGSSVAKLIPKAEAGNLVVVYDDIDLPFGELKVSFGRGDGGHNGIKSIIGTLGTKDFVRVRVGIAKKHLFTGKPIRPTGEKLNNHVLGDFSTKEQKQLPDIAKQVTDILSTIVTSGKEKAMNTFNT